MAERVSPQATRGELAEVGCFWFQLRPGEEYSIRFSPFETALVVKLLDNDEGPKPEVSVSGRGENELLMTFSKLRTRANWGTLAPYAIGRFAGAGTTFEVWVSYLTHPWVTGAFFSMAVYTKELKRSPEPNG